jgi:hypothetical protein
MPGDLALLLLGMLGDAKRVHMESLDTLHSIFIEELLVR